jgi:hypothetical protein
MCCLLTCSLLATNLPICKPVSKRAIDASAIPIDAAEAPLPPSQVRIQAARVVVDVEPRQVTWSFNVQAPAALS